MTRETLHFSDVQLDVHCDCGAVEESIERTWAGARRAMVPPRRALVVDITAATNLRIRLDGHTVWDAPVDDRPEDVFEVVLYRNMLAEHRSRLGVFHGAAVASDAATWIFSGPSGAGKSTMAIAALQRGYRYFTDEFVVTDGDAVWGWPRTPELDPPRLGANGPPRWYQPLRPPDDRGTCRYPLQQGQVAASAAPSHLVHFVRLEPGSSTTLHPLTAASALGHWLEGGFFDTPVSLGRLVGPGRAWRAEWRDPDELLDLLESLTAGRGATSTAARATP